MQYRICLDGQSYEIDEEYYVVTDSTWSCGDRWYVVGFPAGNFGVTVMIRADNENDAIENVGQYVHDNADNQDRPEVPRIILVDDAVIQDATSDEITDFYWPINGGEFYIALPAIAGEVEPVRS